MNRRWLLFPAAALLAWAGTYMAVHPYAARFAIGIWPVPPGTPWSYQLWSGFIPALTVLSLFGGVFSLYWRHTCHVDNCPRLARYPVAGGQFSVCRKHHPDSHVRDGLSEEALHRRHHDYYN